METLYDRDSSMVLFLKMMDFVRILYKIKKKKIMNLILIEFRIE